MREAFLFPTVLAHRGAHDDVPENTLRAFQAALDAKVKWLEFDVMLSQDDVPIIFHDDSLAAMTDGDGLVAEHSFAALQQLTLKQRTWDSTFCAGHGDKIPSLAETLAFIKTTDLAFNLEIKVNQRGTQATCQRILAVLTACEHFSQLVANHHVSISSFSRPVIEFFAKHAPTIPLAYLIDEPEHDALQFAQNQRCVSVNFWSQMPDAATFLENALAVNMPTLCFTVNSLHEAHAWLARGVKGFFTNNAACYYLAARDAR